MFIDIDVQRFFYNGALQGLSINHVSTFRRGVPKCSRVITWEGGTGVTGMFT